MRVVNWPGKLPNPKTTSIIVPRPQNKEAAKTKGGESCGACSRSQRKDGKK